MTRDADSRAPVSEKVMYAWSRVLGTQLESVYDGLVWDCGIIRCQITDGRVLWLFPRQGVSSDRLLTSWQNTHKALALMIEGAREEEQKGIRLDELKVSLSVSAEGNIAFVRAKAEASIVLKAKRS
jgi:hypothetical protein